MQGVLKPFEFIQGRGNRARYWTSIALLAAFMLVGRLLLHWEGSISEVLLAFLCVPRLHDIGRSGWWMLLLIPIEVMTIVGMSVSLAGAELLVLAANVLLLLLIVALGLIPGQREANRFGLPPAPGLLFKPSAP